MKSVFGCIAAVSVFLALAEIVLFVYRAKVYTWWNLHGTKIIGFATAAIGVAQYVDAQTLHLVETVLGPRWGVLASHLVMLASGLATAYRGFRNSNAQSPAAK